MVPVLSQQRGPDQLLALAHLEFVRLLVGRAKVPPHLGVRIAGANASLRRMVDSTLHGDVCVPCTSGLTVLEGHCGLAVARQRRVASGRRGRRGA